MTMQSDVPETFEIMRAVIQTGVAFIGIIGQNLHRIVYHTGRQLSVGKAFEIFLFPFDLLRQISHQCAVQFFFVHFVPPLNQTELN